MARKLEAAGFPGPQAARAAAAMAEAMSGAELATKADLLGTKPDLQQESRLLRTELTREIGLLRNDLEREIGHVRTAHDRDGDALVHLHHQSWERSRTLTPRHDNPSRSHRDREHRYRARGDALHGDASLVSVIVGRRTPRPHGEHGDIGEARPGAGGPAEMPFRMGTGRCFRYRRLFQISEYPEPRVSTPRPWPFSTQPNSLRICWL